MSFDYLSEISGRWFLQYTGSPYWKRADINTISFNYKAVHKGEEFVLEDKVEYKKSGKMRFRLGTDYPVEAFERTFEWKAKGINKFFRNRFEISLLEKDYMVLFYEKTLLSPACIDIVTRNKILEDNLKQEIFSRISNNITLSTYLKDVEKVNKV